MRVFATKPRVGLPVQLGGGVGAGVKPPRGPDVDVSPLPRCRCEWTCNRLRI